MAVVLLVFGLVAVVLVNRNQTSPTVESTSGELDTSASESAEPGGQTELEITTAATGAAESDSPTTSTEDGSDPDEPTDSDGELEPGANGVNPIVVENQMAGTADWKLNNSANDLDKQIKGYGSLSSVDIGETIGFHVSVNSPQDLSLIHI